MQLVEAGHCRSHARRCARTGAEWFRRPENCEGPAVAVHLNFVDVLVPQVCWRSSPYGGYGGGERFFCSEIMHFARSSRSSGVERHFSEDSTVKSSSSSRAPAN